MEAPHVLREVLDLLDRAAAASTTAAGTTSDCDLLRNTVKRCGKLIEMNVWPKAISKKVINEMQIPSKLVSAAPWASSQHQHSSCSFNQHAELFVIALEAVAHAAMKLDISKTQPLQQHSLPNKLVTNAMAQFESAGLFPLLSHLLTSSAQQLWELQGWRDTQLAAALAEQGYRHDLPRSTDRDCSAVHRQHSHAKTLLTCTANLMSLSRGRPCDHAMLSALAGPTLQLSLLVLQHVSRCLDLLPEHMQQQQQPEQPPASQQQPQQWSSALFALLTSAAPAAEKAIAWADNECACCQPARSALYRAPYFLPASCSMLLLAIFSTLLTKERKSWQAAAARAAAAAADAAESAANSSNGSSISQWQQQAWAMACSSKHTLLAAQMAVLRLTGCSSKALLWAATAVRTKAARALMLPVTDLWSRIVYSMDEGFDDAAHSHPPPQQQSQQEPSPPPPQQQQHQQQQHQQQQNPGHDFGPGAAAMLFLGPVLVLHWATHYLSPTADASGSGSGSGSGALESQEQEAAMVCINQALLSGALLTSKPPGVKMELQLQQWQGTAPSEGYMQQQMRHIGKVYGWQAMPHGVFVDVIGEALGLSIRVVPLLLAAGADSCSSNGSSGGCCSDSSGSSSGGSSSICVHGPTAAAAAAAITKEAGIALQALLVYVESLSRSCVDDLVGEGYSSTASTGIVSWQFREMPLHFGVWCEYAGELLATFESIVRQQAVQQVSAAAGAAAGATADVGAAAREVKYANMCSIRYHYILNLFNPIPTYGMLLEVAVAAGPGSREQQQLYGLLRSMVKWAGVMGPMQQGLADQIRTTAVVVTANLLARSYGAVQGDSTQSPHDGAVTATASSSCSVWGGSSNGSSGAGSLGELTSQQKGRMAANALHMLPWLSLLGCCCLQWAQQLQQLPTGNPKAAAAAAAEAVAACGVAPMRGLLKNMYCHEDPVAVWSVWDILFGAPAGYMAGHTLVVECMGVASDWLGVCAAAPGVVAAGYQMQALQQQLDATFALVKAVATAAGSGRGVESVAPVVQGFGALGSALSAVAHKRCCNNPGCVALCGPSELQLVKGRSNTCSGCRTARYCSSGCMKQHWKQHRPVCKALAAAAATAAARPVPAAADQVRDPQTLFSVG